MPVSHAALYSFFRQLLPDEPNDLIYHSPLPRHRHYDPSKTRFTVDRVILSLTPTQGVYAALQRPSENKKRSALFLHRPFTLDRRRVPVSVAHDDAYCTVLLDRAESWLEIRTDDCTDSSLTTSF